MDIGTAKPAPAERRVPYHCIDLVDPGEPFSAALFQRDRARGDRRDRGARRRCRSSRAAPGSTCAPRSTTWSSRAASRPTTRVASATSAIADENGAEALHALLARARPRLGGAHPPQQRAARRPRARDGRRGRLATPSRPRGSRRGRASTTRASSGSRWSARRSTQRIDARVDAMVGGRAARRGRGAAGRRIPGRADRGAGDRVQGARAGHRGRRGPRRGASRRSSRRPGATRSGSSRGFGADPRIAWIDVTELSAARRGGGRARCARLVGTSVAPGRRRRIGL